MTSPAEFTRQGLADAERALGLRFRQWMALRCPGGGPAEAALIAAGQRLASWRRLSRRGSEGIAA